MVLAPPWPGRRTATVIVSELLGARTDGVRPQTLRLEHAEELVTRAERPRVGAVRHQQEPQRGEVDVLVVLGRQQAPVQVARLDDRYARCGAKKAEGRCVLRLEDVVRWLGEHA